MSSADRRQREKQALKDHLLATAWELFSTRPADEVTIRVIAEAAEYSPRTLYLHFADRSDLLAAVVEEAYRRTAEALDQSPPPPGDPLAAAVRRHVAEALGRPRLYETIYFELWRPGAVVGPWQQRVEGRVTAALQARGWAPAEAALTPVLLRSFTLTLVREGWGPEAPEVTSRVDGFLARWIPGAAP